MNKIIQRFNNMSENDNIVLRNILGAFIVKGLALVVSLFTMPAYIRFFNDEVILGLWFTILSVLNWILNFDLGIGNGLRNNLAKTISEKNYVQAKKYISSAYISIGILCLIILTVFIVVFNYINWNRVFNIDSNIVSQKALLNTVKIVFIGIVLQLFFKLISSILYALQKSSVNNFLSLCTSIITVVMVSIIPSKDNEANIICMAIIHVLAVIVPLLVATVVVFAGKTLRKCMVSIKAFSFRHAKDVLSLGGLFLFVQIAYMLIMNTNEYLITVAYSSDAVVDYQIYYRLFSLGSSVFSLAMTPVWSAVTKAFTEKNQMWIISLTRKLLMLAALGTICEFLLIPFLQIILKIWLGNQSIDVNYIYATVFAIFGSLMIFSSALSSIANGIGELKTQAIAFSFGAILKIILSLVFVTIFNSWIGVVIANTITVFVYCIAQPIALKKALSANVKF